MPLLDMICSMDPATRNRSLAAVCQGLSFDDLLSERESLDRFRHESNNLYHRVRALFFLYAINRFHLPARPELRSSGRIPYGGVERLLARRFDEAARALSSRGEDAGAERSRV